MLNRDLLIVRLKQPFVAGDGHRIRRLDPVDVKRDDTRALLVRQDAQDAAERPDPVDGRRGPRERQSAGLDRGRYFRPTVPVGTVIVVSSDSPPWVILIRHWPGFRLPGVVTSGATLCANLVFFFV